MTAAFPAHAGMNREYLYIVKRPGGVPRACGDEPGKAILSIAG